jgi:hypothetical protein
MSSPSGAYEQPLVKPNLAVKEEQVEYGFIGKPLRTASWSA